MSLEDNLQFEEQAENAHNTKMLLNFFVWVIVLGVVGFCEVLYVAMMLPYFPDGFVRLVAVVGAAATGLSAVVLLAGKLHWFSKGAQSYASWGFVSVETCILVLNVLLAVQMHGGQIASWMDWWKNFYAAAPVIAFIGWGIILYLDRSNLVRSMRRDQEDKHAKSELAYEHLLHQTKMKVKHTSLKMLSDKLQARMESAHNQEAIDHIADGIYSSVLSEISGLHVPRATQPPTQQPQPPIQQPSQVMSSSVPVQQSTPNPLSSPVLNTNSQQASQNGSQQVQQNGHQS